jgi:hypothetical protein
MAEDLGNCSCGQARIRFGYKNLFSACPVCWPPKVSGATSAILEEFFDMSFDDFDDDGDIGEPTTADKVEVAQRIPAEKRRPGLSFDHHLIAVRFGGNRIDYWLNRAEKEKWTIDQMRAAIPSMGEKPKKKKKAQSYGSSTIKLPEGVKSKRKRRTSADMEALCLRLYSLIKEERPMTVRQVFYRMVSTGAIRKDEKEYKTVSRLLVRMRRAGRLPFSWIADNTRWMRKPTTYSSLEDALDDAARTYRRALWSDQEAYVEVWLEKDALAGVLYEVTQKYDVPLMVVRGFSSVSFLYEAAQAIEAEGKPAFLYYFGDYDPSGLVIPQTVERDLRGFAPGADITFERIAVTREQIESFNLPTRPTKKTDSRSKGFIGESVEVDAIPPDDLRAIVTHCIERHIDKQSMALTLAAEKSERAALLEWRRAA